MNEKISKLKSLAISRYGQKWLDMRFTKNLRIRLNHELEIIEKTQTEDDFLSFIQQGDEAKSKGDYYVKGTANCSLLLYCTNTTTVDPLAFNLPFERFLNPLSDNGPYFEIVYSPKRILTQSETDAECETLFVLRAIENGQLSDEMLNSKPDCGGCSFAEEILKPTGGALLWQEQLIELLSRIGGFSYAEADKIRRDIAKKHIKEIFGEVRPRFLKHAVQTGYAYRRADEFFDYMTERSPYLPCKAYYVALTLHATCKPSGFCKPVIRLPKTAFFFR